MESRFINDSTNFTRSILGDGGPNETVVWIEWTELYRIQAGYKTIIGATEVSLYFRCCFVSKLQHIKGDWRQNSRLNRTFHTVKIMDEMGKCLSNFLKLNLWLNVWYTARAGKVLAQWLKQELSCCWDGRTMLHKSNVRFRVE